MEEESLIARPHNEEETKIARIRYRWVILAVFSLFSFIQSAIWDTWGPVSKSANVAIGFTEHDYDLLSNWAPIGILPTMPLFIWLINQKGPRIPTLIGGALVTVGTGLRCLPVPTAMLRYFIHAGQLLNAIAGCSVMGTAPLISNIWFLPDERVTATSCMLLLGNLGNAFSYLIGPAIVDPPNTCSPNASVTPIAVIIIEDITTTSHSLHTTSPCTDNTQEMRKQISTLMYSEFAFAIIVFLLIVFFFRNKPDLPPSASAARDRLQILSGLRALFYKGTFWIIVLSNSLVLGAYFGWYGIITVLIGPHGISEKEAGLAAFVMTLAGAAVGILIGWFTDRLKGRLKWTLFTTIVLMFVVFLYLTTMVMDWVQIAPFKFSRTGFWISFILFGCLANALQPLAMEMAVDIAFPVQEGTSTSVFAWFIMLFMFVFLTILNAVEDQSIAHYLVLGFTGVAAPMVALTAPDHNTRLTIDRTDPEEELTET